MEHAELFDHRYAQHRGLDAEVLEQVVTLALEIAREGREGRKIGTLFVIGDSENVLEHSKPLIYDPLAGHPAHLIWTSASAWSGSSRRRTWAR